MNKHLTTLVIILNVLFLVSCQKDAGVDLPASSDKVKTYTEDITSSSFGNSVTTYNLTYDASDRVISFVSTTDAGNKFVYSYPSANTIFSDLYVGGVVEIHDESYMINNSVDSSYQYNNTGDTSTEKYLYNSSGLWIKTYEYDYSKITGSELQNTITYTYDANGNQLTEEGADTNNETYTYYDDLIYIHPLIGPALIPAVKNNLMKTYTATSNGYPAGSATFTYTFDGNNRVSTEKAVTDDGSVVIKTYTYF